MDPPSRRPISPASGHKCVGIVQEFVSGLVILLFSCSQNYLESLCTGELRFLALPPPPPAHPKYGITNFKGKKGAAAKWCLLPATEVE
jgi:hypothetical protein